MDDSRLSELVDFYTYAMDRACGAFIRFGKVFRKFQLNWLQFHADLAKKKRTERFHQFILKANSRKYKRGILHENS